MLFQVLMFGIKSWCRQLWCVSLHSGGRSHGATASPASLPSELRDHRRRWNLTTASGFWVRNRRRKIAAS